MLTAEQAEAAVPWSRGDLLGAWGLAVTALGTAITLIGFGVAIKQLSRTANATEATLLTIKATSRTHLLFLLPQFRLFETELDWAIEEEKRDLAARVLASYAYLANEVAGLLAANQLAGEDAIGELRETATLASNAKNDLFRHSNRKIAGVTQEFRTAASRVSQVISELGASNASHILKLNGA